MKAIVDKKIRKKTLIVAMIGMFFGIGSVQSVIAQGTESQTDRTPRVLDEILITATKKSRAENVQDVPIAITAMGADQLEAMHFEGITDIGHTIPNATLDASGFSSSLAVFFIRGMGINSSAATVDPAVGVTINGMALGKTGGMTTDDFDLESLEVLRGPQGTLFGRNATGGVVVLRTKRPTGDFGFEARGTLGSYDRKDIALGIENSLVEDKLAGRLALMYKDHNGYFKNVQGGRIGASKTRIIRPTLVFTPSELVDVTLFTEYGKRDAGMPPVRNIFDPDTIYSTVFPPYTPPTNDLQTLDQDLRGPNTDQWWHTIAEVNWEVGPGRITSITAYREQEMEYTLDIDGSSIVGVHFLPSPEEQDQFSQEIRYAFDVNDGISLTTGLYYFDQSYRKGFGLDIFGGQTFKDGFFDHKTYAAFAQSEMTLTQNLVLTLGGRYTRESKSARLSTDEGGGCAAPPANDLLLRVGCNYDFVDSKDWNNFSPKVGLQWIISDTKQAYASWTRGFKSGGYDNESPAIAGAGPVNEEIVTAYEIGLKMDLLNDSLRLNLAAFFNDYEDMQRYASIGLGFNQLLNAGAAEIMGFEAELNYVVTERLSLNASLGLMQNDIKEFNGLDLDGDAIPDPEAAEKLELSLVPDVSYGLGLIYTVPMFSGELAIRSDYSYTGERYATVQNNATLDPYRSLNVGISYSSSNEQYNVSLFGKNILDDDGMTYEFKDAFWHISSVRTPATWGIEMTYKY